MLRKKTISTVALTHQGLVRERNEDRHSVVDSPDGSLLVLADGMGGTNAGEVAAGIAVTDAIEYFLREGGGNRIADASPAGPAGNAAGVLLKEAILHAHGSIRGRALADTGLRGMGTTLIMGWIAAGGRLTIAWSGDSRCYHYRPGIGFGRLSKDHSFVQTLVDEGLLDAE